VPGILRLFVISGKWVSRSLDLGRYSGGKYGIRTTLSWTADFVIFGGDAHSFNFP